jgi:hypothetical protein
VAGQLPRGASLADAQADAARGAAADAAGFLIAWKGW